MKRYYLFFLDEFYKYKCILNRSYMVRVSEDEFFMRVDYISNDHVIVKDVKETQIDYYAENICFGMIKVK